MVHRPQSPIKDAILQTCWMTDTAQSFLERLHPDTIARVNCGDHGAIPPRFITGYWSIRGLGAPIRMLLASSKIPHWVLLYDALEGEEEDGKWDKSSWLKDKAWLSSEVTPLINLPYLVDLEGGEDGENPTAIAHTNAILLYLDRIVLSTQPSSEASASLVEQLLCEIMDLRDAMISFAYKSVTTDTELERDGKLLIEGAAQPLLQRLEKYIAFNRSNLACDTVPLHLIHGRTSAPDFHLFEVLDQIRGLSCNVLGDPTVLNGVMVESNTAYPFLSQFLQSFPREASRKAYFSSTLYKLPYNSPYARFGSDPKTLRNYKSGQEAPWRALGLFDLS